MASTYRPRTMRPRNLAVHWKRVLSLETCVRVFRPALRCWSREWRPWRSTTRRRSTASRRQAQVFARRSTARHSSSRSSPEVGRALDTHSWALIESQDKTRQAVYGPPVVSLYDCKALTDLFLFVFVLFVFFFLSLSADGLSLWRPAKWWCA